MKISLNEIKEILSDLIHERKSREEIASWAQKLITAQDNNNLEYNPSREKKRIWGVISYLTGVDLLDMDGSYFHSLENFIDFIKEMNLSIDIFVKEKIIKLTPDELWPLLGVLNEIMASGVQRPDPRKVPGAVRWDVPAGFREGDGVWGLVIQPEDKIIIHFLYDRKK